MDKKKREHLLSLFKPQAVYKHMIMDIETTCEYRTDYVPDIVKIKLSTAGKKVHISRLYKIKGETKIIFTLMIQTENNNHIAIYHITADCEMSRFFDAEYIWETGVTPNIDRLKVKEVTLENVCECHKMQEYLPELYKVVDKNFFNFLVIALEEKR